MLNYLARRLRDRISKRPPDVCIGGDGTPDGCYMRRWHVWPRNRFCNLYLHRFNHSDEDRAKHDHPWINISYLIEGCYYEITPAGRFLRESGAFIARKATALHRVEVIDMEPYYKDGKSRIIPCWTLFFTGPKVRTWGFECIRSDGTKFWRDWKTFTGVDHNKTGSGPAGLGRGCGED